MHGSTTPKTSARSLGFYVPQSTFPADRGQILCEARRSGAPDEVVNRLRDLPPPPATFASLQEVTDRLGASAS